jgi:N-acetylglutamate synthase-like GNAT family acetyltransferase
VALMKTDEEQIFELTKMVVSLRYRGFKIGQKLMQHYISLGSQMSSKALILCSNTNLENAIYIYRK